MAAIYTPGRFTDRRTDTPAADLADDASFAGHLLTTTRRAWLRGDIPDADRYAVQVAERAALDARIAAAFAAAPNLDPARANTKRQGGLT